MCDADRGMGHPDLPCPQSKNAKHIRYTRRCPAGRNALMPNVCRHFSGGSPEKDTGMPGSSGSADMKRKVGRR